MLVDLAADGEEMKEGVELAAPAPARGEVEGVEETTSALEVVDTAEEN